MVPGCLSRCASTLTSSSVPNLGVGGQTSTQIAVREGGVQSTATISGGVIPASGSVTVTFPIGYEPITSQGPSGGVSGNIANVHGVVTLSGSTYSFTRSTAGSAVAVSSAPLVIDQPYAGSFDVIWSGRNDYSSGLVLSNIQKMVGALNNPTQYLVLSVLNGNYPSEVSGQSNFATVVNLNSALAAAFSGHYLDIRSLLIANYNPWNPEDVLDFNNGVVPSSLRATNISGTLASPISSTASCSANPITTFTSVGLGAVLTIDSEKIWVTGVSGTTISACTRGYAGTTPATHANGAAYTGLDPIHLSAAGYTFVANQVASWLKTITPTTVTLSGSGICTIAASQAGGVNFSSAGPVTQTFAVNPQAQTITFGAIPVQVVGSTISLNASASSGLTVAFNSQTPSVCTVSGTTASLVTSGACTIQASQAGNSMYSAAASVSQTFTLSVNAGPVSVSPNSGSGASQAFTAIYSDPNGASDLPNVQILFNTTASGSGACYVMLLNKLLYLQNDGWTGWSTAVNPGTSAQVSNSQCTLSGTGSSYTFNGDTVTLTIALTFNSSFTGHKNIYLRQTPASGTATPWVQMGTWGALGPASVVSISPNSGSGPTQVFSAIFTDPNGATDLNNVQILFNTTASGANACYVMLLNNHLYLQNDAWTGFSSAITPGSSGTLSNSQCTLSAAGSSYTYSGYTVTLNVALSFNGSFASPKNIYLRGTQTSGANTGWIQLGSWTP